MDELNVAIVEDDRSMREGLTLLIDGTPGFRCRAAFGSVEDALRASAELPPHVVLLDINLPGMSGTLGVIELQKKYPGAAILMLTAMDQQDSVFQAICNGACGYLLKKTPPARLLDAIREVHDGGSPMSPEIACSVIALFRRVRPAPKQDHNLTEQEVRLLRELADGHSYESAGRVLAISINTVRNYIRSIYEKLHVHSKSEAVSKAIKQGIL